LFYNLEQITETGLKRKDIIKNDILELIFENRNKGYGAYYLRRHNIRYTIKGLIIASCALFLLLISPIAISYFHHDHLPTVEDMVNVNIDAAPIPQGVQTSVYVPPPPPAKKETDIPKVVKDPLPEEKKPDEKKVIADNSSKDKTSKDTTHAKPTGKQDGDQNAVTMNYDEVPTLNNGTYKSIGEYIKKNAVYPENEKIIGRHSGTVVVTAIVNKDGTLSDVHLSDRRVCPELNAEALRVIKSMPKLNPAKSKGQVARIFYQFKIDFVLNQTNTTLKQ
jgi:protein TonB